MSRDPSLPPTLRRPAGQSGDSGGMSVLMVFLIPAFILIFAAAIDLTKLNAQRKYVQAQADLAALSAVRRLPDAPDARMVATDVVSRNPMYGAVRMRQDNVEFGTFRAGVGLVPGADQHARRGLDAVGVTVVSRWDPILLDAFFPDDDLWVTRRAVAARRDVATFTLRNALLLADTRRSVLDNVLGDTLRVDAALLSYEGLSTSQITAGTLTDIASAQAGADLLTFEDVLDAELSYAGFLSRLAGAGLVPASAVGGASPGTFRLGDVLSVAPGSTGATWNPRLPDLSLSMFDLLFAIANLSGDTGHHRVSVATGLTAAPLADARIALNLVDPGVTVHGPVNATQPLRAEVAQIQISVSGSLAGLVRLELDAGAAVAEAWLTDLDCRASQPDDIVARLQLRTAPAELRVTAGLLAGAGNTGRSDPVVIAGRTSEVIIRIADIGQPIEVGNPILVSAVTGAAVQALERLGDDLQVGGSTILASVTSSLGTTASALDALIANRPLIDGSAQALLDLLGIRIAAAEVVFHGYGCSSALVQ
jgi:uncharacterized membrane protein